MPLFDNAEIFRQFVDLLPFGAYIADPARKILYWNRRAEQITGFLAQEVVGHNCAEDILEHCTHGGAGVCDSERCPLLRVVREGRAAEARLFLRHKAGHRVPVLVRTLPLRDEQGRISSVAELFQEETVGPDGLCWITENIDRFDSQMGLPSVTASRAQLQMSLAQEEIRYAAFVIELDQLQEMAVRRGREMTNVALRALGQTVSRMLTMPHYLGGWADSRLLVVVPHCNPKRMETIARMLQEAGSACNVVWWGERVPLAAKVKATLLETHESIDSTLARLESTGRGEK